MRAGDLLAALEDRDLVLDRLKWRAERDKLVQKQREVRAKHDRTNVVILESQIRQAEITTRSCGRKTFACADSRPLRWNCRFGRS